MILEITIAYIIGILGGLYKQILYIVPFLLVLLVIILKNTNTKRYIKTIITKKQVIIFILVLIIGYMHINILEYNFKNKYKNIESNLNIKATIISNPEEKEYTTKYIVKVEDGKYKNTKLILNMKGKVNIKYEYGDKIQIKGEYEEPEGKRNYGGFSYKEYLKTKKIYGTITTTNSNIKLIKKNNINFISKTINDVRLSISNKIDNILGKGNEEAAVLNALLIGNKEKIEEEIIKNFKDSSLSHMMAISGAHVSYVILGVSIIFSKIKIGKKKIKIITIIFLLFFMVLVGLTPSVVRACIMSIYVILAGLLHKKPNVISSLSIPILILLIYNPYYILDMGLQLSYGGTIGIILLSKRLSSKTENLNITENLNNIENLNKDRGEKTDEINNIKLKNNKIKTKSIFRKTIKKIMEMMLVTISANIIIIPIMMYHFNTVSLTFIISNIIASPILGVIIILGFITVILSFIFMPLAIVIGKILSLLLKILILIAQFCSNLPFSQIYVKTPNILSIVIYYILIFIILRITSNNKKYRLEKKLISKIKKSFFKKLISSIIIITIIFSFFKIIPKNLKIYFVDVGQGDSSLIVTPYGKKILIDGGGSKTSSYNVGEKVLLPYLLDRKITKIDYCIITHFDTDHCRTVYCI